MDKKTKNYLMYAAGAVAAYFGYKYYKKKQGEVKDTTEETTETKTAPTSPTFEGAAAIYANKVKKLQGLLNVSQVGGIGPITIAALSKKGINYKVDATNIDKAISDVQNYKINLTTPTYVAAINLGGNIRFIKDVNAPNFILNRATNSYVATGSFLSFKAGSLLGKGWRAVDRKNGKILIYKGNTLQEIPISVIAII